MASLPEKFFARRAPNYFSLRVVYPTSRLPGDRSSEFGRVRMERDGWSAWGEDEDFGRALRAACHRAGRECELHVLLAEIRSTYMRWYHETELTSEAAYEQWVASLGDASGPGQDRDANSRI